jgi:phage terminase large subunit-like protein
MLQADALSAIARVVSPQNRLAAIRAAGGTAVTLELAPLHKAQTQIVAESQRFNVVACGRRFGKTELGKNRCADTSVLQFPVGWFAPTYKMLLEVWRDAAVMFKPITARASAQERRIEFTTGGVLEFWSLDNPDVARGRKYKRVIIDEAAMVSNLLEVWQMVIRPTLADYAGDAWFLSTPKGHNGFKTLFDYGTEPDLPDWACWQMPTMENPYIPSTEIEAMRQELPESTYNQEVLAVFNENESAVFRNISANMNAPLDATPEQHTGHTVVIGVDWGKHNDYTAVSVGCATCMCEVELDRSNRIDYAVQRQRLAHLASKWGASLILAESNAMGEPIIEMLQREGLPVRPFQTTASTKPPLIENLKLSLERSEFQFLNIPVATSELAAYEQRTSHTTGRTTYSAPDGMHDDTVIARALLRWLTKATAPIKGQQDNPFYN